MKTKIAILGCGKIALRIIKGISYCDNLEIVGFGASDPLRAREYCEKYGGHLYGTYDDILNSEEVEIPGKETRDPFGGWSIPAYIKEGLLWLRK